MHLSKQQLVTKTKSEIKLLIKEIDTEEWKMELAAKSTLYIYRMYKSEIEEVKYYANDLASVIMFRARTNTLQLNDRNRHTNNLVNCQMCNGEEYEDLTHFLIDCPAYERFKKNFRRSNENIPTKEETIANYLLFNSNDEIVQKKK